MWLFYGLALVAGILNAIESGQNSLLSKTLGLPSIAAIVVLAVGGLGAVAVGLATGRLNLPSSDQILDVPWWAWLGGLSGVFIIFAQLFAAERIGAARFLGVLVTAGVITSILLDNYALLGFKHHSASPWRIAGGVLMIIGVTIVSIF